MSESDDDDVVDDAAERFEAAAEAAAEARIKSGSMKFSAQVAAPAPPPPAMANPQTVQRPPPRQRASSNTDEAAEEAVSPTTLDSDDDAVDDDAAERFEAAAEAAAAEAAAEAAAASKPKPSRLVPLPPPVQTSSKITQEAAFDVASTSATDPSNIFINSAVDFFASVGAGDTFEVNDPEAPADPSASLEEREGRYSPEALHEVRGGCHRGSRSAPGIAHRGSGERKRRALALAAFSAHHLPTIIPHLPAARARGCTVVAQRHHRRWGRHEGQGGGRA